MIHFRSTRNTRSLADVLIRCIYLVIVLPTGACDSEPPTPAAPEPGPDTVTTELQVPEQELVAFIDINVVPMEQGGSMVLEGYDVVVRDGVIQSVVPKHTRTIPHGATLIDGTGRYLVPGLVDMHSHVGTNYSEFTNAIPPDDALQEMAEGQLLLYLANGVTTIVGNGDFIEPVVRWGHDVENGRYPGPNVYAALWARGGSRTPDGGPPSRSVESADDAREHVRAAQDQGFAFIKTYNWTPADALTAIFDETAALGMGVIGHLPETLGTDDALKGLDLVAHAESFLWTHFDHRVQAERVPELVAMTRKAATTVTTTLDITRTTAEVWGGNDAGIAAFWARPETQFMHWTEVALHREGIEGPRWNPPGAVPGELDARAEFVRDYTRALYDAGVPLVAGTDAPTVLGVAGFSMHREMAALQGLGLSNFQVLETATRNPGAFIEDFDPNPIPFGTVQPLTRADLLVLTGNPLEDLTHLQNPDLVMARGRLYDGEKLREALGRLASRYASPSFASWPNSSRGASTRTSWRPFTGR